MYTYTVTEVLKKVQWDLLHFFFNPTSITKSRGFSDQWSHFILSTVVVRVKGKWTLDGSWLGNGNLPNIFTCMLHLVVLSTFTQKKLLFLLWIWALWGVATLVLSSPKKCIKRLALVCLQQVSFVMSLIQTVEHETDFKLQFLTNWTRNQMKNWCLLFIPPPLIGLCDTSLFPFKNIPIRNPYSTAINRVSWFFILVQFLFKKRTIRNPTLW